MSEVTQEFMLEQFRRVRGDIAQVNERLDRVERRLEKVETHTASLVKDDMAREAEFSSLVRRVARIEHRLDLREADA